MVMLCALISLDNRKFLLACSTRYTRIFAANIFLCEINCACTIVIVFCCNFLPTARCSDTSVSC